MRRDFWTKLDPNTVIRLLFSALMLFLGLVIALLANTGPSPVANLAENLGLALIITGFVAVFEIVVLEPLRRDEIKEGFDRIFNLLAKPGIRILTVQRQGYPGYHRWVLEGEPQEMFFAGHSGLHRVQIDFASLGLVSVEQALKQKISEGSKIRILFLDPTWDFIDNIARMEGQDPIKIRHDLATTLGISRKLWESLEREKVMSGEIEIRTCVELVQYAFHHVTCRRKNEVLMLLGFYFAGRLGTKSPLFLVEDEQCRDFFAEHFRTIFERGKKLLVYSRDGTREFNDVYYHECQNSLSKQLDNRQLSEICP